VHPAAPYLLPLFAIIYLFAFCEAVWWRKWGYLLTNVVSLLTMVTVGAQMPRRGCYLGMAALGLMVYGAYLNRQDRLAAQAGKGAG
jgi:hypothetical protein